MVKIKGGMTKTWISEIRKHSGTKSAVEKSVDDSIKRADSAMKVRYPRSGFSWFFKKVTLKGNWGNTHIINATTPMSKKHREVLISALLKNGLKRK